MWNYSSHLWRGTAHIMYVALICLDSPVQSANWKWLCSASQSCFYCICNDLSLYCNQSNCTKCFFIWVDSATVIFNDDKDSYCVKAHYSTDHKNGLLYNCVKSVLTQSQLVVGRPTQNFTYLHWFSWNISRIFHTVLYTYNWPESKIHLLVAESTIKLDKIHYKHTRDERCVELWMTIECFL